MPKFKIEKFAIFKYYSNSSIEYWNTKVFINSHHCWNANLTAYCASIWIYIKTDCESYQKQIAEPESTVCGTHTCADKSTWVIKFKWARQCPRPSISMSTFAILLFLLQNDNDHNFWHMVVLTKELRHSNNKSPVIYPFARSNAFLIQDLAISSKWLDIEAPNWAHVGLSIRQASAAKFSLTFIYIFNMKPFEFCCFRCISILCFV